MRVIVRVNFTRAYFARKSAILHTFYARVGAAIPVASTVKPQYYSRPGNTILRVHFSIASERYCGNAVKTALGILKYEPD